MCIRDSYYTVDRQDAEAAAELRLRLRRSGRQLALVDALVACLLYTSDAADERSSVDLGGRRSIKKKKTRNYKLSLGSLKNSASSPHYLHVHHKRGPNHLL